MGIGLVVIDYFECTFIPAFYAPPLHISAEITRMLLRFTYFGARFYILTQPHTKRVSANDFVYCWTDCDVAHKNLDKRENSE